MNIEYHQIPDGKLVRLSYKDCSLQVIYHDDIRNVESFIYPREIEVPYGKTPKQYVDKIVGLDEFKKDYVEKMIVTYRGSDFDSTNVVSITGGSNSLKVCLTSTKE